MGKPWSGTREENELIREISKYPIGTPPIEIFDNFDSQTWEVLKSTNRTSGNTKEWSVYRILCKMLKDSTILEKVAEFKQHPTEVTHEPPNELEQIIEEAFVYFNSEVQKSINEISRDTLKRIQNKINDQSFTIK